MYQVALWSNADGHLLDKIPKGCIFFHVLEWFIMDRVWGWGGDRIWALIPVYWYENPSGYISADCSSVAIQKKIFSHCHTTR